MSSGTEPPLENPDGLEETPGTAHRRRDHQQLRLHLPRHRARMADLEKEPICFCSASVQRDHSPLPHSARGNPAALRTGAPPPGGQAARRGGGRGGFGGPIELGPDDKPAFDDPPAGFSAKRDNIPHGELTTVEYDSKSVGTRRKMLVYTPPGYSTDRKYPVLYLLHGIGGNDREWQRAVPRGERPRQPAGRRQDPSR